MSYPVENPTPSFWLRDGKYENFNSHEALPESCDICIVGGGFSGVACAYHLLNDERGAEKSIALLEARGLCSGASGRNGGFLKHEIYASFIANRDKYGLEDALSLVEFERENVEAFCSLVKEQKIDCDLNWTESLDTFMTVEEMQRAHKNLDAAMEAGVDVSMIQILEQEKARNLTRIFSCVGAITRPAGSVSVYKFVTGLLLKCITKGLMVFTHSRVESIFQTASGAYDVFVNGKKMRAKKIVVATNGYSSTLIPEFNKLVVPVKLLCTAVPPKGEFEKNPTKYTYGFKWAPRIDNYMIQQQKGDRMIIVGGARAVIQDKKDLWNNTMDDSTIIDDATKYLESFTTSELLGWGPEPAKASYSWAGIAGYSNDGMPFIGEFPGRSNLYVTAGYTGHGMPRILLGTQELSKVILGYHGTDEMNIPGCFKSTPDRISRNLS